MVEKNNNGTALLNTQEIFDKIGLADGMRVADLGCGRTGHFVFLASRIVGDTGIVYAVDIMKDILENIRSRVRSEGYHNVQTVWSDIETVGSTPVPEGSLDVCFLVNVAFLLKNKAGALKEASRLLKSGGFAVVVDWAKKLGPLGPPPELMTNPDDLLALAVSSNLKLFDKIAAGDYHYCLLFKKA